MSSLWAMYGIRREETPLVSKLVAPTIPLRKAVPEPNIHVKKYFPSFQPKCIYYQFILIYSCASMVLSLNSSLPLHQYLQAAISVFIFLR